MTKPTTFRSKFFSPLMLLLCIVSLQSCWEEMPVLKPLNPTDTVAGSVSSKSIIYLNINNAANNITNIKPSTILFTNVTGGATLPLFKEYFLIGDNESKSANVVYTVAFHTDTIGSKKFIFESSELVVNKKTYSTFNISGSEVFAINQLDDNANTASGKFSYYLYDSVINPKDSIFVDGTFSILK